MNGQITLFQEKKRLRDSLKQRRAEISESDRKSHSIFITDQLFELQEIQEANVVFAYISYATEVITHDILKRLLSDGKRVVVPKILNSKKMVAQHFENWNDLEPGTLGILTPKKGEITDEPVDIAITPGLGFTEQGHRIGFGAGYYDRWFATHEVRMKIAISFETQIVAALPIEKTDIPVDRIVTEKRLIKIT